ncbi:YhfC family glutamic-type intramembrane protease, partial [Enterococcus faecium]|nr:YhfC family glutamic-type intramembrane protease [Enterococcus faecium]
MIETKSPIFIVLTMMLLLIFSISLFVIFRKKFKINFIPILVGFIMFILFVLILEPIFHQLILRPTPDGNIVMKSNHPILYMFYGAFAAGIFEEVSRYIGLTLLKKRYPEQKTSIAYGFGHGFSELFFLGFTSLISNLVLMISVNQGNTEIIDNLPTKMINTLINTPSSQYLLIFIERAPVMIIQILLTIIVWYGIKHSNTKKILPLAIIIHASIDLIAGAYQVGYIQNMILLYVLIYLATFILFIFTKNFFWSR